MSAMCVTRSDIWCAVADTANIHVFSYELLTFLLVYMPDVCVFSDNIFFIIHVFVRQQKLFTL